MFGFHRTKLQQFPMFRLYDTGLAELTFGRHGPHRNSEKNDYQKVVTRENFL